jgi:DNA polymerase
MAVDRADALAEIAAEINTCKLCRLYQGTTHAVPGAGNPNAEILFIGEGPGFNEDRLGLPFVGPSGKLLERLLGMIGLKRDDVFITNIVKHRPPENRDPLPDEIAACHPYLEDQIRLINPLLIATLGRHSMARYFPNAKITQIHGKFKIEDGRAYMPLFHPAAILRNDNLMPQMEADFHQIPELLEKIRAQRANEAPKAPPSTPSAPPKDAPPAGPPTQLSLF